MKKPQPKASPSWILADWDKRPLVVALAGPNGAGKTTFYEAHLKASGLRFLNADILAGELGMDAYQGAEIAAKLRQEFVSQGESFIFETMFSDPVGDKLSFLNGAAQQRYDWCLFGGMQSHIAERRRAGWELDGGGLALDAGEHHREGRGHAAAGFRRTPFELRGHPSRRVFPGGT